MQVFNPFGVVKSFLSIFYRFHPWLLEFKPYRLGGKWEIIGIEWFFIDLALGNLSHRIQGFDPFLLNFKP